MYLAHPGVDAASISVLQKGLERVGSHPRATDTEKANELQSGLRLSVCKAALSSVMKDRAACLVPLSLSSGLSAHRSEPPQSGHLLLDSQGESRAMHPRRRPWPRVVGSRHLLRGRQLLRPLAKETAKETGEEHLSQGADSVPVTSRDANHSVRSTCPGVGPLLPRCCREDGQSTECPSLRSRGLSGGLSWAGAEHTGFCRAPHTAQHGTVSHGRLKKHNIPSQNLRQRKTELRRPTHPLSPQQTTHSPGLPAGRCPGVPLAHAALGASACVSPRPSPGAEPRRTCRTPRPASRGRSLPKTERGDGRR